jgi:hypothetical protein
VTSSTWHPPNDPRPSEILHSAVRDTREGRHAQALAKFLWFHNNALKFELGQGGVRLSFALGYWMELASLWPPALDAFLRTRNETEVAFFDKPAEFDLFHDLAAMNDRLGQGIRTANIFEYVAKQHFATAAYLYHVAEPHLVADGRFQACGPFLDPHKRLELAAECYRHGLEFEASRDSTAYPAPPFARRNFIENVATLVSLLVINDRREEARAAYDAALRVIDDDDFRTIMDAAMAGHLPEPRRE